MNRGRSRTPPRGGGGAGASGSGFRDRDRERDRDRDRRRGDRDERGGDRDRHGGDRKGASDGAAQPVWPGFDPAQAAAWPWAAWGAAFGVPGADLEQKKKKKKKKKKRSGSSSSDSSAASDWRQKVWNQGWQGSMWQQMMQGQMPGQMGQWPGMQDSQGAPPPPPPPPAGPGGGGGGGGGGGFRGDDEWGGIPPEEEWGGGRRPAPREERHEPPPQDIPIYLEPAIEEFVPVPKAVLGKVIGKQAQTIIEIREKSGAFKVDARDQTSDPCQVKVAGTADAVKKARQLIEDIIESTKTKHTGSEFVEIPRAKIGMVIGLKGGQVNQIQADTGTKIDVDFDTDPCKCYLKGEPSQVEAAKQILLTIAMQIEDGNSEYLDLPKQVSGALIGSAGSKVREFQEQSGARIDVDKTGATCRVRLTGTAIQVANAKQLIRAEIEQAESHKPLVPMIAPIREPMVVPAHQPTTFPATLSESIARAKAAAQAVSAGLITRDQPGTQPAGQPAGQPTLMPVPPPLVAPAAFAQSQPSVFTPSSQQASVFTPSALLRPPQHVPQLLRPPQLLQPPLQAAPPQMAAPGAYVSGCGGGGCGGSGEWKVW